jgi:hypothetical protein
VKADGGHPDPAFGGGGAEVGQPSVVSAVAGAELAEGWRGQPSCGGPRWRGHQEGRGEFLEQDLRRDPLAVQLGEPSLRVPGGVQAALLGDVLLPVRGDVRVEPVRDICRIKCGNAMLGVLGQERIEIFQIR